MELDTKTTYKDYSLDAELNDSGNLKILEGKYAINNALRLWLSSFKGDIIRKPNSGGYLTRWLVKPLTEDTALAIKRAILDGLNDEFSPALTVTSMSVIPKYKSQYWEIHIEAYCSEFREDINIIENIRRL